MHSVEQNNPLLIRSPCVRNCCLDQHDICLGCGRSIKEITSWTQQSEQQKLQTLAIAEQRLQKLANNLV
ncbi:DUF1289 domain-containing protein [Catenovulum sp. SX2]|uniref:DUF1289 domain-containing protein n=1 Tax=Catenovulum sp. SX2 TaxID=3398614 RepID=UPI003F8631FB